MPTGFGRLVDDLERSGSVGGNRITDRLPESSRSSLTCERVVRRIGLVGSERRAEQFRDDPSHASPTEADWTAASRRISTRDFAVRARRRSRFEALAHGFSPG